MINYEYEYLFRQDSISKTIHIEGDGISLDNSDIYLESFDIEESINSDTDLIFGSCISSVVKFTTSAIATSFIGKFITITLDVGEHTGEDSFLIGTYKVLEETLSTDKTKKEITAYDYISSILEMDVTDWYNSLTFPISLLNFRNSFFTYIGVTQVSTSLINDSFNVQETILPSQLSGKDVILAICELNGCFGKITRDNKFKYVVLDNTSVYSITASMYSDCDYEDYTISPIDKVIIRQEENDVGGSYGSGDNTLVIQGNFLVYGSSPETLTTVATNIYSVVSTIVYTPCKITCIGNPCLETGDRITFTNASGITFNTYVLNRTLTGIQALKDNIDVKGNKTREKQINSEESKWLQLLGKSNKLTRTVEETVSEVSDLNGSVTTLTQTSDYLVSEVQNINRELNGENLTWQGEGVPTLLNYPYWDFTSAFKCDGTKRCAPIYNDDMTEVEEGEEGVYPHHYYSEQDRQDHVRDLYIDLDTGNGYRFVKTNGVWNWQLIADSDFAILFNQISELRQDVDSIDLSVQNDEITIADHESRITHNEGELTVQAGLISAKVSEHTQNGDNTFSFDLLASGVKFTSNSTDVLTIGSTGIKIQGNAEFTGKITATSGYIGTTSQGFSIGSSYIRNGMNSLSDTTNDGVYVGTDGIALGKGAFKVTKAGACHVEMNEGSISLGNFAVTSTGAVTIASGSINLANNFIVNSSGVMTLKRGSINLGSGKFTVNDSGYMTSTSGKIGCWTIKSTSLDITRTQGGLEYTLGQLYGYNDNGVGHIVTTSEVLDYTAGNVNITANSPTGISTEGKITLNATAGAGTIALDSYYVTFNNYGRIISEPQKMRIYASDETDYPVLLGVRESMWAFAPYVDTMLRLGSPNYRWNQIYSTNSTINTSDKNEKKYIKPLKKSVKDFVMALNPVSYQFKNGESGRTHYGLIAQDVEETMKDLGMTDLDFAGFCKDRKENSDDYIYGLRYEEFIAPLIKMIQLQQTEIEELKRKVG